MANKPGKKPYMIAFGNPLLDQSIVVEDTDLHKKFGLPVDGQLEVTDDDKQLLKLFDIAQQRNDVTFSPGGCALNTSRVFTWVLGEKKRTVFVGGIGMDSLGQILSGIVQKNGVKTRFIENPLKSTGCCVALVYGAQRCLTAHIGAAEGIPPDCLLEEDIIHYISTCSVVYVEGYFITHSFQTALQVGRLAKKLGKPFIFNLCGSYVCEKYPDQLAEILPYIDILFGYIEEYSTLRRHVNLDSTDSLVKCIENIFGGCDTTEKIFSGPLLQTVKDQKVVIVTQGPNPLLCSSGLSIIKKPVIPIDPNDIVDTTGAGDSFVGGFLAAMVKNCSLDQCIDCGMWTARQILKQRGCSIPTKQASFEFR